jgi:hypothetical protein
MYPNETNGLTNGAAYHDDFHGAPYVDWTDRRLRRITRLRLLTDPGFPAWDVSYCHGELVDGSPCRVQLPFDQLPRRGMREAIVKHAIRDGVHAKRLGVFDALSQLW